MGLYQRNPCAAPVNPRPYGNTDFSLQYLKETGKVWVGQQVLQHIQKMALLGHVWFLLSVLRSYSVYIVFLFSAFSISFIDWIVFLTKNCTLVSTLNVFTVFLSDFIVSQLHLRSPDRGKKATIKADTYKKWRQLYMWTIRSFIINKIGSDLSFWRAFLLLFCLSILASSLLFLKS